MTVSDGPYSQETNREEDIYSPITSDLMADTFIVLAAMRGLTGVWNHEWEIAYWTGIAIIWAYRFGGLAR